MSYRKARCFLVIWLCLLINTGVMASTRLITCREQGDQTFVCLPDAVELVKNHLGEPIRIIGYSDTKHGEGFRIAAKFRRQLIDALEGQGIKVDESLFKAVDGGVTGQVKVEVY